MNVTLRAVRTEDGPALREAVAQMAASDPGWVFAFRFDAETDVASYAAWLEGLRRGREVPRGWVPQSYFLAWADDVVVGRLSLRHTLNEDLLAFGGHMGFGVLPAHRGCGLGHAILAAGLREAARVGLQDVLLTCADDNAGSIAIIEAAGGVLEDKVARADGGLTRRYWIRGVTS